LADTSSSMSALNHKRTYALQNVMSALPPKADICSAQSNVCFRPKADIIPHDGIQSQKFASFSFRPQLLDFQYWHTLAL
jgi:hypothetical protein